MSNSGSELMASILGVGAAFIHAYKKKMGRIYYGPKRKKFEEAIQGIYQQTKHTCFEFPNYISDEIADTEEEKSQVRGELNSRIKKMQRHCEANPRDFVAQGVLIYFTTHFEELFIRPEERREAVTLRKRELIASNPELKTKIRL